MALDGSSALRGAMRLADGSGGDWRPFFDAAGESLVAALRPAWWIGYPLAGALLCLLMGALIRLVGGRALRSARRRAGTGGLPWYEAARLAQPMRQSLALTGSMMPLLLVAGSVMLGWPLGFWDRFACGLLAYFAGQAVFTELARRSEREITGRAHPRREWRRTVWFARLVFNPTLLLVAISLLALPREWGLSSLIAVTALALIWWGVHHRGTSVWLAYALGWIRPAGERLAGLAARAEASTGIKSAGVVELRWPPPNAFAFPHSREIGATTGALRLLDDDELHAVLCHELGHVADAAQMHRTRSLTSWLLFPIVVSPLIIRNLGLWVFLGLMAVALLAVSRLNRASRHWERRADSKAARDSDPRVYLRALEKLHRYQCVPAVLGKRQRATHPDLYQRFEDADVDPGFPKPDPPAGFPALVKAALAVLVWVLVVKTVLAGGLGWLMRGHVAALPVTYSTGERASLLLAEAGRRARAGNPGQARVLAEGAAVLTEDAWRPWALAARHALAAGEREIAERDLLWAEQRRAQLAGAGAESDPELDALRARIMAER